MRQMTLLPRKRTIEEISSAGPNSCVVQSETTPIEVHTSVHDDDAAAEANARRLKKMKTIAAARRDHGLTCGHVVITAANKQSWNSK